MSKYFKAIRLLARAKGLDADNAERLLNAHAEEQDGGPGSGNFGHAGRPGKRGGSAPGKGGGSSSVSPSGKTASPSSSGNFSHSGRPGKVGGPNSPSKGTLGNAAIEFGGKTYTYDPSKINIVPYNYDPSVNYKKPTGEWYSGGRRNIGSAENRKDMEKAPVGSRVSFPNGDTYVKGKNDTWVNTKDDTDTWDSADLANACEGTKATIESPVKKKKEDPFWSKYKLSPEESEEIQNAFQEGRVTFKPKKPELYREYNGNQKAGAGSGVSKIKNALSNAISGMNNASGKNAEALKKDLEWVAEAPDNKEFLRRSKDVRDIWDKVIKEGPADFPYKEYGEFVKAAEASERMSNRGYYGHSGVVGKRGGSGEAVANGIVGGNLGQNSSGHKFVSRDYSLKARGLQTIQRIRDKVTGKIKWTGPGKTWEAVGKKSQALPNGSGTTRISEKDIAVGLHTINKYLDQNGRLTPERAEMHEKIIQKMFEGKQKPGPGEPKTFYFLGGGSASGKSSFTKPGKSETYSLPNSEQCTVIDPDLIKDDIPEYQFDNKTKTGTGTTNRNIAASWAHEESSALAKRAMETAFANGYNCTLDGTGDSGADKVIKKLNQARNAGYRVEGRYCTKDIEKAIETNIERSIRSGRMVQIDELVRIHKDVSNIFEEIAPHFDHVELWDHNDRNQPVLIATCERGGKVQVKDQAMYDRFIEKKNYNYDSKYWKKKADQIRKKIEAEKRSKG